VLRERERGRESVKEREGKGERWEAFSFFFSFFDGRSGRE